MTEFEVLIIGAGASGLAAANELIKSGKRISILEARERTGGRINTFTPDNFSAPVETGAEFIHGDLPVTRSLLKEADIPFHSMEGITYQVKDGKLSESENFIEGFPLLLSQLNKLKEDLPFSEFLDKYFNDKKYDRLRKSVTRFAEGYDAADIKRVSSFALRDEWSNEDTANSYRIKNGYSQLIIFLADEVKKHGCPIYLASTVKEIIWKPGQVEVVDHKGQNFKAKKTLITVPISVLQIKPGSNSFIKFSPELTEINHAARSIGIGTVIKYFFEFREPFWELNGNNINQMPGLGFLLSDAEVPTWWTQLPDKIPLLTGWLAGPKAEQLQSAGYDELLSRGIKSLSYIFGTGISFIQQQIKASYVINWKNDPYALGAYAYSTVESKEAKKILLQTVENTIFFAGEALYEGHAMGTVEAALVSGINSAKAILQV